MDWGILQAWKRFSWCDWYGFLGYFRYGLGCPSSLGGHGDGVGCPPSQEWGGLRCPENRGGTSVPLPNGTNLTPEELANSTLYRGPVDPANWFGIRKGFPNWPYVRVGTGVLAVLSSVVYRRQQYHRKQHQLVAPVTETIFEDISRQQLDLGLVSCAKYFINYFYYKFGLEICFLMMVNVIGQRMNFVVILHGCWLVVMLTRRRRAAIARLWPKYCLFLVIFFLYQYLLCLGMPPALCMDYPWRWSDTIPLNSALIKWLYLPDFFQAPNRVPSDDFMLLLCAAQQWRVFKAERSEPWLQAAGDNSDRLDREQDYYNPTPNFIYCKSYLDMVKVVVFHYLFWVVLVVVFITGANRISLFGLGYVLACFYLLLSGTAMLRKPARARLVLWDCLILYNITVIISKNMLSVRCDPRASPPASHFCWVIQLFSLVCTVKGYYNRPRLHAARGGGRHHLGQHLLLLPPAPAPHLPQLLLLARHVEPPSLCPAGFQVGLGPWRVPLELGVPLTLPCPPGVWRCSRPAS
uniref:Piezo TM25-28 domain-containing protein n=1 Tax=Cyanistes caeruleus TaxID=156563 RepID=A0A8C0UDY1_CYACU